MAWLLFYDLLSEIDRTFPIALGGLHQEGPFEKNATVGVLAQSIAIKVRGFASIMAGPRETTSKVTTS